MRITFRLGELFCGPGGIALGARMASETNNPTNYRISHVWATDYDKDTCKTYSQNICGKEHSKTVIHEDIRTLDIKKLEKISNIDALAFGFPCNDFSIVGEQKGIDGVFGPLYQYGINLL
ncbi:MAG: DNA cytosine methyltransferase [Pyrinomonadaceae bacterium]|nr:DNA cytosine methyltransferase [Pyrinomonadaceae bacterium]